MSNSSAMERWIKRHIEGLRRRLLRVVAVLMLSANPHPVARVLGVDGTV
jgi:hypothetical protein